MAELGDTGVLGWLQAPRVDASVLRSVCEVLLLSAAVLPALLLVGHRVAAVQRAGEALHLRDPVPDADARVRAAVCYGDRPARRRPTIDDEPGRRGADAGEHPLRHAGRGAVGRRE